MLVEAILSSLIELVGFYESSSMCFLCSCCAEVSSPGSLWGIRFEVTFSFPVSIHQISQGQYLTMWFRRYRSESVDMVELEMEPEGRGLHIGFTKNSDVSHEINLTWESGEQA